FLFVEQFMGVWPGAIYFCCDLGEPGVEMLDKAFRCHGKVETLAIFGHFRLAFLPAEELVTVVGILLGTSDAQITALEFFSDRGKDAGFQVLTDVPALAFAPDRDSALPLCAGKREIKGRFQIL